MIIQYVHMCKLPDITLINSARDLFILIDFISTHNLCTQGNTSQWICCHKFVTVTHGTILIPHVTL